MTHTCPTCNSTLHTNGALEAWITPDGRVVLLTASAKPSDHRWIELPASAQNWLAEILHQAHQAAQTNRA
jgi:hypothetical protein